MVYLRNPWFSSGTLTMTKTTIQPTPLTEYDIRRWVGEASFGRGVGYYHEGHILHARRQGDTLKARCVGSEPQPYYVQVTLDEKGIASGDCSCYVGAGGHCKHAAALLLTWLHDPERFQEQETLEEALEARSQAELIALIRRMLNRYPDLESLLEIPLVVAGGELAPVDAETIRVQVSSAFWGDEWGPSEFIPQELEELVKLGDAYAGQERWTEAATVYQVVMEEILDAYRQVDDEMGELARTVNDCVSGLGQCLEGTHDPARRDPILRALFHVYRWDVEYGGIDMGYEATDILLTQATAAEKRRIAGWVREAMPPTGSAGGDWSADYHRQVYGRFLLGLEGEQADDETYLGICRETGRWQDLVDRLLALDRVEEATAIARERRDYDLLQLADLFLAHGHVALAVDLVRERASSSRDGRLAEWLKRQAAARGDLAEALAIAETLFWQHPDMAGYVEIRDLAQQAGGWETQRGTLLARLGDAEHYRLLAEIYLEEGEIDRALETLGQVMASRWGWGGGELAIRIAQAAEESRPRAALQLYAQQAEGLIRTRGRGNYATAATYLARVRALYRALGEPGAWEAYIAALREDHRRLRALKEELGKAGL
jgi:uncharacterized Zn finger protein